MNKETFRTKQHSIRQRLEVAQVEFFEWLDGKREHPPKNPFLPQAIEEGGLVEPFELPKVNAYPEGKDTELVMFPQTELVYDAKIAKEEAEADASYYSNGDRI